MFESLDRVGGGLVNIILGALILWVGQTTFHHAGQLATVDQKFESVNQQFIDVDGQYEGLRKWLEKVVNSVKDNNRYNFTRDDAEKLVSQIRKLDTFVEKVERRLTDRLSDVEVKLASVETRGLGSEEVAALQMEVTQLRSQLNVAQAQSTLPPSVPYQTAERIVDRSPVYLPAVEPRR